jgi:hypothetical protein
VPAVDLAVHELLDLIEVVVQLARDDHARRVHPVVGVLPPCVEVEPVLGRRELALAGHQRLGTLAHLVELAVLALGRGLHHDDPGQRHGLERARDDLDRLVGELRADLAELRHVQPMDRAAAHGSGHAQAGVVVREEQFLGAGPGQREALPNLLGQMVVCEHHLVPEDRLGRLPVLGDHAATLVAVEQRMVQPHDRDQRGETQLPRLEDQIAMPQPQDESPLRPVGLERHDERVVVLGFALDDDLVQAAREQPPLGVHEAPLQFRLVGGHHRGMRRDVRPALGPAPVVPAVADLCVHGTAWLDLYNVAILLQRARLCLSLSPWRHRHPPRAA